MGEWGNILASLPYKEKRKNVFNDCPMSCMLGHHSLSPSKKSCDGLFFDRSLVESGPRNGFVVCHFVVCSLLKLEVFLHVCVE